MGIEVHPDQWLAILKTYPVILVLFGGLLGGVAFTQTIKSASMAWPDVFGTGPVAVARWVLGVRLLALVTTFTLTDILWRGLIPTTGSGLRWAAAFIAAVAAPWTYTLIKAAIAWKFPGLAASLGDSKPT